ncbi:hypothetical protein EVAR_79404_1 [Eumeta japonica]|uniref:Uncharacterized protein n=1 Tax=Eumeta variegata TaxID=151549 RepID=A0A4C1VG92_EUMVA|nr:hypothetical protein EVAR_79404_1 [Eumeta japonica]
MPDRERMDRSRGVYGRGVRHWDSLTGRKATTEAVTGMSVFRENVASHRSASPFSCRSQVNHGTALPLIVSMECRRGVPSSAVRVNRCGAGAGGCRRSLCGGRGRRPVRYSQRPQPQSMCPKCVAVAEDSHRGRPDISSPIGISSGLMIYTTLFGLIYM